MKSFLVFLILLTGCQSWTLAETSKVLIPVNATGAYFGALGLHELGHAGTALGLGSDSVQVDMLPGRDSNGDFHFGMTTAESRRWSDSDEALFSTMGPTASFLGHLGCRELLKTGVVPKVLQPTLAWLSLGNQIAFYYHVGSGLLRIESSDLGKQELWISLAMLAGGLTYDIYDLASDDFKNFKVMVGEDFYESESKAKLSLVSSPLEDGGYLGLRLDW